VGYLKKALNAPGGEGLSAVFMAGLSAFYQTLAGWRIERLYILFTLEQ
jgi:hypothetical protein